MFSGIYKEEKIKDEDTKEELSHPISISLQFYKIYLQLRFYRIIDNKEKETQVKNQIWNELFHTISILLQF